MNDFEKKLNMIGEMGRGIRMTDSEKSSMRENISEFINNNPLPAEKSIPVRSPYASPFSIFAPVRMAMLLFVGLFLGTSGVSYASLSSLPGDALYPIKIGVVEQVAGLIVSKTPEKRLAYEESLVYKRLDEIEELKKQNRLNIKTTIYAKEAIAVQSDRFNKASSMVESGNAQFAIEKNNKVSQEFKRHENLLRSDENKISVPTLTTSNLEIKINPIADEIKARREHLEEKGKIIEKIREQKRSVIDDVQNVPEKQLPAVETKIINNREKTNVNADSRTNLKPMR